VDLTEKNETGHGQKAMAFCPNTTYKKMVETEIACKISAHLDLNWQSYIH